VALSLAVSLTLAACSQGGLTAAERSRATTLPTPSAPGIDARQVLAQRVNALVASPAVSVDEDLTVDGVETEARLNWKARGTVVDSSVLNFGSSSRSGTEVFRSPSELLSRSIGNGAACWAPAGPSLARYDRPVAQELTVLRSARAIKAHGSLISGTLSARALLRIVGTDDQLRRLALLPASGVQVEAIFHTDEPGLQVTLGWSNLVAAAGNSSRHTRVGTWILSFRPAGDSGPAAPAPDQVVSVPPTDPSFHTSLLACNARLQ
jgi:hypothetical protein